MADRKPILAVLGGSHARRIYERLHEHPINMFYDIKNFAKGGSEFSTLLPYIGIQQLEDLRPQDVLLVQTFGNSLFNQETKFKFIKTKLKGNGKLRMHMVKYDKDEMENMTALKKEVTLFLDTMKRLKCKIFLINHIARHFLCCKKHHWQILLGYQTRANQYILNAVRDTNIQFLSYMGMLIKKSRDARNIRIIDEWMSYDKVHLSVDGYFKLACVFVEEYLQPISGIPLNEFPIRPKPPVKKPEESRSRRLRMRKREKLEELRKRLRKCGNEFRRALKHKWASDAVLLDREINKIEDKIQKEEEEEDKEEVQVIKESIEIKIVRKIELDPRAKRASELERLERRCKKHPYFKSYYEGLEKNKPSVSEKSEPEVVVID